MNEYFQTGAVPAPSSPGASSVMRQEFANIAAGFDKLPVLAGHANEIIFVDATGSRLETNGSVFTDLVTLTGTQELINKTIAWASNTFTGFNDAATKVAGTGAGEVLLLAEANKLPALDGSLVTNLNVNQAGTIVDIAHGGTGASTLGGAQTSLGIDLKADASNAALTGVPTAPTATIGTNTTQLATTAFVADGLALKANANNAVLTGAPTAPTPLTGDASARIATTYFVADTMQAIGAFGPSSMNPLMNGTVSPGVAVLGSRSDHVHPSDTSRVAKTGDTMTGSLIVSANNASPALRVTQEGAGAIAVFEDATNPDSTPTVIDTNGNVIVGGDTSVAFGGSALPLQSQSASVANGIMMGRWGATTQGPYVILGKSRGANQQTLGQVLNNDDIGSIWFAVDNGLNLSRRNAEIVAQVDGVPDGANNIPGRLSFKTTAPGAATATERMRIDSAGTIYHYAAQGSAVNALTRKDYVDTKAPIDSPTFTGDPKAPTPLTSDNDTSIATTAFVQSLLAQQPPAGMQPSNSTPLMNGTAAAGTGVEGSRYDHVHPSDTSKVNKSGDTLTGGLWALQGGSFLTYLLASGDNANGNLIYRSDKTTLAGGTGLLGTNGTEVHAYVGCGSTPWNSGLKVNTAGMAYNTVGGGSWVDWRTTRSALMQANCVLQDAAYTGLRFTTTGGTHFAAIDADPSPTVGSSTVLRIHVGAISNNLTLDGAGNLTASGNVTAYSDAKLKKDLVVIPDALAKVLKLTGYTYTRIDTEERQTGLIAQDVQAVLPEAVGERDGTLNLAYGNLAGLFAEAIKELVGELSAARQEIAQLRADAGL
jgi:hypothetical protein